MPHHHTHANAQPKENPDNQFHILPVLPPGEQKTGEIPAKLTDGNSFKGEKPVTQQPGPVIVDQLGNLPVTSTEALDQRAAELNKPPPH